MLNKSLVTSSDMIVYDLEDSVPPSPADKDGARNRLSEFIQVCLINDDDMLCWQVADLCEGKV